MSTEEKDTFLQASLLEGVFHGLKRSVRIKVSVLSAAILFEPNDSKHLGFYVDLKNIVGCVVHEDVLVINAYSPESGGCCGDSRDPKNGRKHEPYPLRIEDPALAQLWRDTITLLLRGVPGKLVQEWIIQKQHKEDSAKKTENIDGNSKHDDALEEKKAGDPLAEFLRPRKITIFVNPASGSGDAPSMLTTVATVFQHSGAEIIDVIETKYKNQAKETVASKSLEALGDSIVIISGDGMVHEVLNGLMNRDDWQQAVNQVTIGHIPGGSGNALAESACHVSGEKCDPVGCAFMIAKNLKRSMDLLVADQEGEDPLFLFLSLGWAIVSDIDFESEDWRCCGGQRFFFSALARICCLRTYQAQLAFVQHSSPPSSTVTPSHNSSIQSDHDPSFVSRPMPPLQNCQPEGTCHICINQDRKSNDHNDDNNLANALGINQSQRELASYLQYLTSSHSSNDYSDDNDVNDNNNDNKTSTDHIDDNAHSTQSTSQVAAEIDQSIDWANLEEQWETVDGDITLVWALNLTHGGKDIIGAKGAHFSEGCFDLGWVHKQHGCCSTIGDCYDMFQIMDNYADGSSIDRDSYQMVKARACRLTPSPQNIRESQIAIDGEMVPYKPITIRNFRAIINVHSC